MIPSWAKVGAKVVCTKRGPWVSYENISIVLPLNGESMPSFGKIYTLREIEDDIDVFVRLGEITNPALKYNGEKVAYEMRFLISHFRPLVVTKTQAEDMQMFRKIIHDMTPVERLDRLANLLDMP